MCEKNVAILFGGASPEYSVSLASASSVISHMDRTRFTPVMVGISQAGDWYLYEGDLGAIASDTWHKTDCCTPAMLSPHRSQHKLLVMHPQAIVEIPIDVVFPVLHGKNGEDGTVQGLCELSALPLVGCGTLASALAMDKDRAHKLAQAAGVAVPQSFVLTHKSDEKDIFAQADHLGYPLFVKPIRAGSSYGISKVMERSELCKAIASAFAYDDQVMVEAFVPGFEVGCAVMGNQELITGEIDEIELADGFFDFTEKYNLITSKTHVPARIPPGKTEELKRTAKTIYRALGCQGFARVDMFLQPSGEVVFNEVNTIPGFTPHSRFPSMMQAAGKTFAQVITHAVELALEKEYV